MKRLMIDMDNCITDALFMDRINEFLGTNYKLEEQTEFRLQKITGNKINDFWDYMKDKSFYDDAPLIDDVYETLEILNKKYDLYIITAFIYPDSNPDISANNLKFKYEYLKRKLPFISPKQYIFLENKNLIHSDIAIDDRISHLENTDKKILMTAWHNKNLKEEELKERGIVRVNTWKEILELLDY